MTDRTTIKLLDFAALHALAHAGQRAQASVATAADTDETTTGGQSDE